MGRVAVVLAGVAVLALQVWLTLYAQVVLAYEAAVIAVVLVGIGLRGYARSRRRRQRADAARWPDADGIPVPQPTPAPRRLTRGRCAFRPHALPAASAYHTCRVPIRRIGTRHVSCALGAAR